LSQIGAHISTHVNLAACLTLSKSILNTVVKNHEEIKGSYIQCGPFSKQQKSLKCSPLEKLDSALAAWFKQVWENNASTDRTYIAHHHSSWNEHLCQVLQEI
jgi:hypothetical protein